MDFKTAAKIIDFIFSTPSKNITIEFQGGESLINWNVLKKSVRYILTKNKKIKKELQISVVTNLSLMDEEKLNFLIKNNVSICTSLDGPEDLHNKNRIFAGGSSYKNTVKWIKEIFWKINEKYNGSPDSFPSALMTTTRHSLGLYKEIIDEYKNLGFGGIFIRPLSPIGFAKNVWDKIGYSADEFLKFYEKSIDYIIYLNLKEGKFVERNAAIKLKKLLFNTDPNFLDLRSPCGAGIGQLAYNFNGDVYTCDEGRMVGAAGDAFFKAGNIFKNKYREIVNSGAVRMCCVCSTLENQPYCARCAFKHYCGICPVYNYEISKTPWGNIINSDWCKIEKGIFKIILKKIKNKAFEKIFQRWFDDA